VPARDAVVAAGIVINGLPIALKSGSGWSPGGSDLVTYYRDCVIGGPGSFVLPVAAADQLIESIREKLVLEIAGMPGALILAADGRPGRADCLAGERLRRIWERDP
jgi:hypothetical protein